MSDHDFEVGKVFQVAGIIGIVVLSLGLLGLLTN
jgi:hypothetical protein